MINQPQRLLILDIDETLVHAAENPLAQEHDFRLGPYFIHKRPHLDAFLQECYQYFQVAYWSAGSGDYVRPLVEVINPVGLTPVFVWARERCSIRFNGETHEHYFVKNLKKVKRRGFDLRQVLIVDDTPSKASSNYGNAIYVRPYEGEADDDELPRLSAYLRRLCYRDNYRSIEKRYWRTDRIW